MPKNLFQNVIFTLMMSFLMVYVMICYNISLNIGGMSNKVFLMAFGEMKIMWPVAFLLEFFIVDKLAHALAFRIVTPNDRPIVITLAISAMIISLLHFSGRFSTADHVSVLSLGKCSRRKKMLWRKIQWLNNIKTCTCKEHISYKYTFFSKNAIYFFTSNVV